ncbi:C3H1-type domain-containing protein [Favolaschia claudopus]|uniref:C3H1-type domain-containing protein n=1 Tax=Favolaschia claudopus TaxID=2862362 RepID=A0AAW0AP92_9AGAR
MSVTKKYRCRYFEEDGRPIHPTCNQGDACRFVHPSDPQWPGLKPFVDTRLLKQPLSSNKRNKETTKAGGSTSHFASFESRGPPLESQSDLFLRCKEEEGDQSLRTDRGRAPQKDWDRDRDGQRDRDRLRGSDSGNTDRVRKNHPRNRSSSPARPYANKYSRNGSDGSRKSDLDPNRMKVPAKSSGELTANDHKRRSEVSNSITVDQDDFSSSAAQTLARWTGPQSMETQKKTQISKAKLSSEMMLPMEVPDETKRTERLVGLFRSLARMSNQVVQDSAAQEREGQKLQTYTEISTALSKISASAANSVAPTLADIMLKHEQSKHRVEQSYKALGGVWEQVFDIFVKEIVQVIDCGLQNAITTIQRESDRAVKDVAEAAAGSVQVSTAGQGPLDRKRARTRGPTEKENEDSRSGRGASRDRDHKRRRFESRSSSPDTRDRRSSRHGGDFGVEDILTQMKMKIDQQAHSLQILAKENNELKTTLKQTIPVASTSCNSFSLSSTPRDHPKFKTSGTQSVETTPTRPRMLTEHLDYFRAALAEGQ